MENTDHIQRSLITFKDSNDVYVLRLVPGRKNMELFSKFLSLILPVVTAGFTEYKTYQKGAEAFNKMLEDDTEEYVEQPEFSSYPLSLLVAEQLKEPEFLAVIDELLAGLYKGFESGGVVKEIPSEKVDLDAHFYPANFHHYLLIVEHAIKENFAAPFGHWLKNKGLSEIGSDLQSIISAALKPIETK